jgi:hypothetical protein
VSEDVLRLLAQLPSLEAPRLARTFLLQHAAHLAADTPDTVLLMTSELFTNAPGHDQDGGRPRMSVSSRRR